MSPFTTQGMKDSRPVLLDLFCCAGGASAGYDRAGFRVVGVDIKAHPNYPYEFHKADAMTFPLDGFDAISASPPCQRYSPVTAVTGNPEEWPDLVAPTRERLKSSGVPWVIENVMSAPLDRKRSVVLCGEYFGLRTARHRRFELSPGLEVPQPPHPRRHKNPTATSRRRERWAEGWNISFTGDVGTYAGPEGMGIDWMNGDELCEAIPPAYTEYIGTHLMEHIKHA